MDLELGGALYDRELPREGVPMDGAGLLLGTLTDGREGTDGAGAWYCVLGREGTVDTLERLGAGGGGGGVY